MKQTVIQVDAFTKEAFQGNPAAVCILATPQDEQWMQLVAREINLSETAFLIRQENGYNLRWFTPVTEVPLCGHATLASAHTLWTEGYVPTEEAIHFYTLSGLLIARFNNNWIELDFPATISEPTPTPVDLKTVFNIPFKQVFSNYLGYLIEVESADLVKQLQPNFSLLKTLPINNAIITSLAAKNSEYDFVSRFFAPGLGINEDPVTGSAHCCLAPFWRDRLKKDEMLAYQASNRGGVVKINYTGGDRVLLAGQGITVMRGELLA